MPVSTTQLGGDRMGLTVKCFVRYQTWMIALGDDTKWAVGKKMLEAGLDA